VKKFYYKDEECVMTKIIDARGLTCPAPVLLVKDTLEREQLQELTVVVDNDACRENVTRFLGTQNYTVIEESDGDIYRLKARHSGISAPAEKSRTTAAPSEGQIGGRKILIVVAGDRLGTGDDTLGEKLMINYLKTIKEMGTELWQLVFINSGVKLTTDDSAVLQELQDYERAGVVILACGTCLEHFGLIAAKKVGATTNMLDIVTAMQLADKVITIG
jgi:selenium metabolism protein YedF